MSIIKDGKTYRTIEEQVYYLTREQAKDEVDITSLRNDKQDKLTTSSVDDGTLNKAIGFDSEGNLVKGNVSANYNDLTNKPIINQTEQVITGQFVDGQTVQTGTKIHFDTTKTTEIQSLLDTVTGETLVLVGSSNFMLGVYNLSGMNLGKVILLQDRENEQTTVRVIYGTQSGSAGEISWDEGFNNLDDNGDFTLTLDEPEEITVNPVGGWNGVFVFITTSSITPVPENGNYYRKPDGKIYYYSSDEYHQVLAEGDLSYDATVIEDSTNAVQGGAVYDALADKQDVITGSDVELNGVDGGVLGFDSNGDLSKTPKSDFLSDSDFPSPTGVFLNGFYGKDGNGDKILGFSMKPYVISSENSTSDKVLIADTFNACAKWGNVEGSNIKSSAATSGQVLTADGSGNASWQNASGGTTLNKYTFDGFGQPSSGFWTKVQNMLCGAKGGVFGWYGVDIRLNDGSTAIQTYIPVSEIRRNTSALSSINAVFHGFNAVSGQVFGFIYATISSGQLTGTYYGKAYKSSDGTEIEITQVSGSRDRTYIEYYNDTQLH